MALAVFLPQSPRRLVQQSLRAMRSSTGQLAPTFAAYFYAGSASRSAWRFL
jgi:hypothetical protein